MKKILLSITSLFFSILFSQAQDISRIEKDLKAITQLATPRNYQNIASLDSVASYLKKELSKVCDSTGYQTYKVQNNAYKNVIGSVGLEHSERIIIGAHYDVYGNSDGADDNGSGVVGLLELARMLSKENLKYRIDFVFYTLEEPPFFRTKQMGSYIHAKYLHNKNIPVKGMICLESIGYFCDEPNSQQYPVKQMAIAFGTIGNYIAIVQYDQKEVFSTDISNTIRKLNYIPAKPVAAPSSISGIDFSDHLNYWKFGYEAVMITNTAFYRNKHYHTKGDTAETLDFRRLSLVVKQLYKTLATLYGKH